MIKTISVKNFQSHKDTFVELAPMVNTFIGLSDSGKSGLIRSIKANLQRAPFYLKIGELNGEVGIGFSDYSICRKVDASKIRKCPSCKADVTEDASYICKCGQYIEPSTKSDYYTGENGEIYEKFGVNIPDFILDKTKIRSISFVDFEEDLNISNQHDDMFFVGKSYSGLRRNKILSSLIPDSEKIDLLIKAMNSEMSKDKQLFDIAQNTNMEIEPKINKAKPLVEEYKVLLEDIDLLESEIETLKNNIVILTEASNFMNSNINKFTMIGKLVDFKKYIEKISSIINEVEELSNKVISIEVTNKFWKENESKFGIQMEEISIPSLNDLETFISKISSIEAMESSINKIMIDEKKASVDIGKANDELKSLTVRFDEFIDKEAICPIIKDKYCDKCKLIIKE